MVDAHGALQKQVSHPLLDEVKNHFPDAVQEQYVQRSNRLWITVAKDKLPQVAQYLRDKVGFDHAVAVSGIDYPAEKQMAVLYLLSSYTKQELVNTILGVRTKIDRNAPTTPSLVNIWPSVEWHERETFEMFGIIFEGHPKLEKLILQDNWDGPPPFRKDFKLLG